MYLITNDALVVILRERICRSGGSSLYAKGLGVSCAFVSAILGGNKYVSGKVLEDLGYERVIGFSKVVSAACPEAPASPGLNPSQTLPRREAGAK